MTMEELLREFGRINFYGWKEDGKLVGVMGIETIKDVTLIRHAYVLSQYQRRGIASQLLDHLKEKVESSSLLVGTWVDATWAIKFYIEHGFTLLPDKDRLLRKYWNIPKRQIEASVVLGIGVG
jgi:GNAT superfamily N-acetyltransferase